MPEKPHFYGNFCRFIFIYSEKLRGAKFTANKKVVLTLSNLIIVLSYFHQIRKTRSDRSNCCITTIPNTLYSLILYSYRAKCNITHSPLLQRQDRGHAPACGIFSIEAQETFFILKKTAERFKMKNLCVNIKLSAISRSL